MSSSAAVLDTSAAIALLVRTHPQHPRVLEYLRGRTLKLTAHSLLETYSVLTRLPGDVRREPTDAAELIAANFGEPVLLAAETTRTVHLRLSRIGIAGGAAYDAVVALAARENDLPLVTRDLRAATTYAAIGTRVEVIPLPGAAPPDRRTR